MAALRLELAGEYIDDSVRLKDEIRQVASSSLTRVIYSKMVELDREFEGDST